MLSFIHRCDGKDLPRFGQMLGTYKSVSMFSIRRGVCGLVFREHVGCKSCGALTIQTVVPKHDALKISSFSCVVGSNKFPFETIHNSLYLDSYIEWLLTYEGVICNSIRTKAAVINAHTERLLSRIDDESLKGKFSYIFSMHPSFFTQPVADHPCW